MRINMPIAVHTPTQKRIAVLSRTEVEALVGPAYTAWCEHAATDAEVLAALEIDLNNAVLRGDVERSTAVRNSIRSLRAE